MALDALNTTTTDDKVPAAAPLRRITDLPAPSGLPWLGNMLQLKPGHFHEQLDAWGRELGPYYQLKIGRNRLLVVGDHEVVAATLRDRPDGFRRTSRLEQVGAEIGLAPGVFNASGEVWRRQRRMVMAGFDPAHVKRYFPSMRAVAQRLDARWQLAAQQGVVIDLQADLMRYTVDTIAGLAFGAEVRTLESDDDIIQQHLDKIFPALSRRILAPFPIWRYLPSKADRELEQSMIAVNAAVDGFITQARARMAADPGLREHPSNLLEAMIAAADQPDSGIDDRQVAGNVLTMLLAGEDTTANTIAWMIEALWRNPQALERASAEVRRVVTDPLNPMLEEIDALDYVEACTHETMRLKPVAPQLPLEALRDTVVGDVAVPKGSVVISLLRRDSVSDTFVPQAAQFMPERWLSEGGPGKVANAAKRISMPFGAGPRVCPGRYLAMLEMKMAMATLLGRFDIVSVDTPDGQPAQERLSFTMMPVGLSMRLRGR
jgi:cytochrome P450